MNREITVIVESEPHSKHLEGLILNRPCPVGGAFLLGERIEKQVWLEMRKAGAWYYSSDMLEEFDMFDSLPGWRYDICALRVLLNHGYTLNIRGENVLQVSKLDFMFSEEGKAAYWAGVKAEKEREDAQKRLEQEERKSRQERKRLVYELWRCEHLLNFAETFANPVGEIQWTPIAYFDAESGGWFDTGDHWNIGEIDGHKIYKCSYGNTSCFYASQDVVDKWCVAHYDKLTEQFGEISAARWVLRRAGQICIGDEIATRLLEINGEQRYLEAATKEEWMSLGEYEYGIEKVVADKFKIQIVHLEKIDVNNLWNCRINGQMIQDVYRHPDGRIFAKTNIYSKSLMELNDEQLGMLGISGLNQ